MSREVINVGAAPNDGQGDPIRTSFIKTNNNFGELYARAQENPPGSLIGSVGDQAGMYAYDSHFFYYCYQDYDGSSVIWAEIPNTVIDAIEIVNGSSNVSIPTANGNVLIGVAGTANLAVFSATGATINGDLTVTGNANLSGNIVGDRITNGTTSIEIPVANGNATISVAGTSNVAVFSSSALSLGGNLVLPSGSRIRGDFSSFPIAAGQRTVFQTTSTAANASTFVSAIPGSTNGNTLGAAMTIFASPDLANSSSMGIFAYASENQILSSAFGTGVTNPLVFTFTSTGEAGRFLPSGNLGLGNTAPADKLAVTGNVYVSNTVTASGLSITGTSTFAGNLMPAANITYDLGNSTNRWNDIWLANSTIYLGNAQLSANSSALNMTSPAGGVLSISGTTGNLITSGTLTGGNVTTGGGITATGNIFTNGIYIGNGSGLTGVVAVANVGAASQFTNGTTTFNIPVADGNIIGNIGGSTNLFEFSTVGLSAAGNITANNFSGNTISVTGNITASGTFVGDGSGLVNVIANVGSASQLTSGTTQINIPVANGNIVANVAGSTNLFQWSTVGFSAQGNITGGNLITVGLATVTGNVTAGNLRTGGVVSATGNVTGNYILGNGSQLSGIITSVANINSGTSIMEVVSSGGNIQTTIGGVANVQVIATSGTFVTGLHSVTGNITGGNVLAGGTVSAGGNVIGANITTGGVVSATGNVTAGNLTTAGAISAAGNVTAGNLSVNTGTVSVGAIENNNANGVGNIGTTGTRFNTVFALASSAQYADLAEYYLADHAYPAGTVVAFGGAQELTICDQDHAVTVAGIISDRPAFEMNAGITGDHPVALALAGRVPCEVIGPIRRGQMLVAAGGGCARAEENPRMGAVIGKALEDFDGTTGRIEVVVGRI